VQIADRTVIHIYAYEASGEAQGAIACVIVGGCPSLKFNSTHCAAAYEKKPKRLKKL